MNFEKDVVVNQTFVIKLLREDRIRDLVCLAEEAMPHLVELLGDNRSVEKVTTVLEEIGQPAISPIWPLVWDRDDIQKNYRAVEAIKRIGKRHGANLVVPSLYRICESDYWSSSARKDAAGGAIYSFKEDALVVLLDMVRDSIILHHSLPCDLLIGFVEELMKQEWATDEVLQRILGNYNDQEIIGIMNCVEFEGRGKNHITKSPQICGGNVRARGLNCLAEVVKRGYKERDTQWKQLAEEMTATLAETNLAAVVEILGKAAVEKSNTRAFARMAELVKKSGRNFDEFEWVKRATEKYVGMRCFYDRDRYPVVVAFENLGAYALPYLIPTVEKDDAENSIFLHEPVSWLGKIGYETGSLDIAKRLCDLLEKDLTRAGGMALALRDAFTKIDDDEPLRDHAVYLLTRAKKEVRWGVTTSSEERIHTAINAIRSTKFDRLVNRDDVDFAIELGLAETRRIILEGLERAGRERPDSLAALKPKCSEFYRRVYACINRGKGTVTLGDGVLSEGVPVTPRRGVYREARRVCA